MISQWLVAVSEYTGRQPGLRSRTGPGEAGSPPIPRQCRELPRQPWMAGLPARALEKSFGEISPMKQP